MPSQGSRREEILQTAAMLFASSGIRTSLAEIADACGILPGSLYHHFDSKEAIIVELVNRYHDDLDRVAKEALDTLHEPVPRPAEERIRDLARAIATCGVEHRAALLLTLYEPPLAVGEELAGIELETPPSIRSAMHELLRAGRKSGAIRPGIDLGLLADRLCQSMLHVGVGVSHLTPGGEQVPDLRVGILLHGLARAAPSNSTFDRSNALRAARRAVQVWQRVGHDGDDRLEHLLEVARAEFGRRGYEARHRGGRGPEHRNGVPPVGLKRRALAHDHVLLLGQGRQRVGRGRPLGLPSPVEAGRADVGGHQGARTVPQRGQDHLGVDAAIAPQHTEFSRRLDVVSNSASPCASAVDLGRAFRRDPNGGWLGRHEGALCSRGHLGCRIPGEHRRDPRRAGVRPRHRAARSGRPTMSSLEHGTLERYELLASAVAGRAMRVAAAGPSEPAWTDGVSIFVAPALAPAARLCRLVLQAALMGSGSLDPPAPD